MKKTVLLFAVMALLSFGVDAQYFVTSYGYELGWGLPNRVQTVVHHNYFDYNMVHVTRARRHGLRYFDLIFQRGDVFVEVSIRNDGFVARRHITYNYPFNNHICGNSCGYHANYYQTFYNACNAHQHHGHNHVVYNPNRRVYVYRGREHRNNRIDKAHQGNRTEVNRDRNSRVTRENPRRINQRPTYSRRGRYQDEVKSRSRTNRASRSAHERERGRKSRGR